MCIQLETNIVTDTTYASHTRQHSRVEHGSLKPEVDLNWQGVGKVVESRLSGTFRSGRLPPDSLMLASLT